MKLIFRGVRGSIPTPGPNTVKYGGNTTCIEIRTDGNDLIILDAGTGIHVLAQQLLPEYPVDAHIFITHTHWDHIQGLPFFMPIFAPGNKIHIYGGFDPVSQQGIERAMDSQFQYSFFPIREAELKAQIHYTTLRPGQSITVGRTRVTPCLLNHPVINFGYRIDCDGRSIFFTGDYEPLFNIHDERDTEYAEFQAIISEKLSAIFTAMADVDALIVDASYTQEEYARKKGWGHGTYDLALTLAAKVRAKRLFFTHHEPNRSDAELDAIYLKILQTHGHSDIELFMAREGEEISL
ncbi:MAG: MBL fold metallo-hydrolase [Gammaproteobacteria bacterium]